MTPITPNRRLSSTRGRLSTDTCPSVYKSYNYPWFGLYDEHLPAADHHGAFKTIRSIGQRDDAHLPPYDGLIDPKSPPNCFQHPKRKGESVFRPCGHIVCSECFGKTFLDGLQCVVCSQIAEQYSSFSKPMPTVKRGEGNWWEAEAQIGGVPAGSRNVVTLMLDEDSVCKLHGAVESVPPPYKRRKVVQGSTD